MERLLNMFSKYGILVLFTTLILGIVQPASAEKKDDQATTSPAATISTITKALARQVAFVKTLSVEYPCQFEQEMPNEKERSNREKGKMRPE